MANKETDLLKKELFKTVKNFWPIKETDINVFTGPDESDMDVINIQILMPVEKDESTPHVIQSETE